jgi:hypothetical protein
MAIFDMYYRLYHCNVYIVEPSKIQEKGFTSKSTGDVTT